MAESVTGENSSDNLHMHMMSPLSFVKSLVVSHAHGAILYTPLTMDMFAWDGLAANMAEIGRPLFELL